MKKILNFILVFGILFLGDLLFPEYIISDSIGCTLVATLIFYLIMIVSGVALILIGSLVLSKGSVLSLFIILFYSILSPLVCLYLCSNFINGFEIKGVLTYILLIIALNIFQLKDKIYNLEK